VRSAHNHKSPRLRAFTLIELIVVILIVAILVAVLAPMMQRRVDTAKWTEGRTGAGCLATGIRTYCAATGEGHAGVPAGGDFSDFQVFEVDLRGKYFQPTNYSVSDVVYDQNAGSISYMITVTAPAGVRGPDKTLDQNGQWTDAN